MLHGEVAEASDLLGLAEMTGVDLQGEIEAKMTKNASRVYLRLSNGTLVKNSAGTGQ